MNLNYNRITIKANIIKFRDTLQRFIEVLNFIY